MKTQGEYIRTLQRRVDFLKAREYRNSYDAAELGALEWALVNLPPQPAPPPECQTEAEKTAYAFGWFKALESVRKRPAEQKPMTTQTEADRLANQLDYHREYDLGVTHTGIDEQAAAELRRQQAEIERLNEALAQQPAQQEPPTVAELVCVCGAEWEWRNRDWELVATPPAQRTWVGLTDEQWQSIADTLGCIITRGQKDAIEAKLREKNQ